MCSHSIGQTDVQVGRLLNLANLLGVLMYNVLTAILSSLPDLCSLEQAQQLLQHGLPQYWSTAAVIAMFAVTRATVLSAVLLTSLMTVMIAIRTSDSNSNANIITTTCIQGPVTHPVSRRSHIYFCRFPSYFSSLPSRQRSIDHEGDSSWHFRHRHNVAMAVLTQKGQWWQVLS